MSKHIYTHKHHIIPVHMGGSDEPSNLIELTIEEHALAHKKLFKEHGRWQDEVAWKCLSGQITNKEANHEAMKRGGLYWRGRPKSEEHKRNVGLANKGRKHTEASKRKMSLSSMGEKNGLYGKKHTEETLKKMRETQKERWRLRKLK